MESVIRGDAYPQPHGQYAKDPAILILRVVDIVAQSDTVVSQASFCATYSLL